MPMWLPGDAKLAAKELAANPRGGELFERNAHRGPKLGRGKSSPPSDCATRRRRMARHHYRDRLSRCKAVPKGTYLIAFRNAVKTDTVS